MRHISKPPSLLSLHSSVHGLSLRRVLVLSPVGKFSKLPNCLYYSKWDCSKFTGHKMVPLLSWITNCDGRHQNNWKYSRVLHQNIKKTRQGPTPILQEKHSFPTLIRVFSKCTRMAIMPILASEALFRENKKC